MQYIHIVNQRRSSTQGPDIRGVLQCSTSIGDSKGGPGWAMAPPEFCLAPRLSPTVFFFISRLRSFG